MAILSPQPLLQFFDANGVPLVSGYLDTYEAGTTTPKAVYKDQAATQPHTNPIRLNARGEPADGPVYIFGSYKFNLRDSAGVQVTGYPVDNITGYDLLDWSGLTASIADLNSTTTTTLPKTADYTTTLTDRGKTILANATSGKVTITLLSAITAKNGYRITIKKTDKTTNVVEIATNGSETIDTNDKIVLRDVNDYIEVISDGSNWKIVSGQMRGSTIAVTATQSGDFEDHARTYLCDASSGAITINLLSTSDAGRGYEITVKKTDASTNAVTLDANGSETIDGAGTLVLKDQYSVAKIKTDGVNWYIISDIISSSGTVNLPRGHIDGLEVVNNSSFPFTRVDFKPGVARNSLNTADISLTATISKRFDQDWVEGNDNGGFSGVRNADKFFHYFVISKEDGTTDAGFDSDIDATNLRTAATGYIYYRRVATLRSDKTLTTAIVKWTQAGDEFRLDEPVLDFTASLSTTEATETVNTPKDITVIAHMNVSLTGDFFNQSTLYATDRTVTASSLLAAPLATISSCFRASSDFGTGVQASIKAINSQIKHIDGNTSATNHLRVSTFGWTDFRGKNE